MQAQKEAKERISTETSGKMSGGAVPSLSSYPETVMMACLLPPSITHRCLSPFAVAALGFRVWFELLRE